MQNQKIMLINKVYFVVALTTLLIGYGLMALFSIEFIRMTLSPIIIIIGFGLFVISIFKPSRA